MTTATREAESDNETRLVRIETRLDSMATKEDLANLAGEIRTEIATRFGEQDAKFEARFGELETKIATSHGDLESKFEARIGELDSKMEARFGETDAKIAANHGELKTDVANSNTAIANSKTEMIRWTVGSVAVSTTIVVSIVTLVEQFSG